MSTSIFQPPPTWEFPIVKDSATELYNFSPVWLRWFLDLVAHINADGVVDPATLANVLVGQIFMRSTVSGNSISTGGAEDLILASQIFGA